MTEIILLPGYGNSGPDHWQSHWERRERAIRRFRPTDWDRPDLDDWIRALDRSIAETRLRVVLVAHSLSCLLVPHWAGRAGVRSHRVAGAFLVAPPDPAAAVFPPEAAGFAPVPMVRLPFPALVVASPDDPYGSVLHARTCARAWGAGFVEADARGHINAASGIGLWVEGIRLLDAFRAGLGS